MPRCLLAAKIPTHPGVGHVTCLAPCAWARPGQSQLMNQVEISYPRDPSLSPEERVNVKISDAHSHRHQHLPAG